MASDSHMAETSQKVNSSLELPYYTRFYCSYPTLITFSATLMAHINLAQPRADDFFLSFLNFFIFTLLAFFGEKCLAIFWRACSVYYCGLKVNFVGFFFLALEHHKSGLHCTESSNRRQLFAGKAVRERGTGTANGVFTLEIASRWQNVVFIGSKTSRCCSNTPSSVSYILSGQQNASLSITVGSNPKKKMPTKKG